MDKLEQGEGHRRTGTGSREQVGKRGRTGTQIDRDRGVQVQGIRDTDRLRQGHQQKEAGTQTDRDTNGSDG